MKHLRRLHVCCHEGAFGDALRDDDSDTEQKAGGVNSMIYEDGAIRKRLALAGCVLLVIATASPAIAQENQTHEFDIDKKELGEALTEFGIATGNQVLFKDADVRGKSSNGLEGVYTSEDAVEALLENAGVDYRVDENGTLLVGSEYARRASLGEEATSEPFRMAQVDQSKVANEVRSDEETQEDGVRVEDTIVVTGTTIRGVVPDSAPIVSYSIEDIELSGATTLDRFFETLPQNLNSLSGGSVDLAPGGEARTGSFVRGSGIDLRGLGVGTTLILLNGRRISVPDGTSPDISLIPLGAIERIEVLADGASAIYGSDAIGGVVNLILREDFEGANVSVSYGGATRGGQHRFQGDVAAGASWRSGSGFASYSYSDQTNLFARERDFAADALMPQVLIPGGERHGFLGSIQQELTDRLNASGTAFYSVRTSETERSDRFFEIGFEGDQEQLFLSGSLDYGITDDLFVRVEGTYLEYGEEELQENRTRGTRVLIDEEGNSTDLLAVVDGKLMQAPGGDIRLAVGGGYSAQELNSGLAILPDPLGDITTLDRDSNFAFAEIFIPIVGEDQDVPGVNRFELSAASRYTDYSDFGDSWTPRLGLLWSPFESLNLRGTYARSFRAPTLRELDTNTNATFIQRFSDRGFPDTFSSDGSSVFLTANGVGERLIAEFSDTYTFGFDFEPEQIDGLSISATYFSIDYEDRLGFIGTEAIFDQEAFGFIYTPSPSLDEVTTIVENTPSARLFDFTGSGVDLSDPMAITDFVTVIADFRTTNLSESRVEGVDFSIRHQFEAEFGDFNYGLNLTNNLTSTARANPGTPEVTRLDSVGQPVSLRFRGFVGINRDGFTGQVNVNYVDPYENGSVDPIQEIDSWTTVDLFTRYSFDDDPGSWLNGTSVSLSVNNLFDEDPPFVERGVIDVDGPQLRSSIGYDPVNANPVGRFVTVGLVKRF